MRKILILLALIFAIPLSIATPAFGAYEDVIRYVDSSCGTAGDGTTQNCSPTGTAPFKEIGEVNTWLYSLGGSVQSKNIIIKFHDDQTHQITGANLALGWCDNNPGDGDCDDDGWGPGNSFIPFNSYGSEEVKIEITRYGSGTNRPKLMGKDYTGPIYFGENDIANFLVHDVDFYGDGNGAPTGVTIYYADGDVEIKDIYLDWANGGDGRDDGHAIYVRDIGTESNPSTITIHDAEGYDLYCDTGVPCAEEAGTDIHFIYINQSDNPSTWNTYDIYNITVNYVQGDAIQVHGLVPTNRVKIHDSYFNYCGENCLDFKESGNIDVYDNWMARSGAPQSGSGGGGATITRSGTNKNGDFNIYGNYFGENDDSGGIATGDSGACPSSAVWNIYSNYFKDNPQVLFHGRCGTMNFYNNVIENDKDQQDGTNNTSIRVGLTGWTTGDSNFYNNTFWHSPPTVKSLNNIFSIKLVDSGHTVDLQNNIIHMDINNSGAYPVNCVDSFAGGALTLNNNLYRNDSDTDNYWLTTNCGSVSDSNPIQAAPQYSTFPEPLATGNLDDAGVSTLGDTYKNAIDWGNTVWTPFENLNVVTANQNLEGDDWEVGGVILFDEPPPEPPPGQQITVRVYGTLYIYGQRSPSSFSRTLRVGQDYADLDALEAAMNKGPVGGLVPGDWLVITASDADTADFSAWDGESGDPITIVDRKRMTGTITLGDYYDLYCGNSVGTLTPGAENRLYPCGTLYFD